jgi:molybdopterin-containing oxidoreductase family iron-sulfur binding subunit
MDKNTPDRPPSRRTFLQKSVKSAAGLAAGCSLPGVLAGCNPLDIDAILQKQFTKLSPEALKRVIRRLEKENLKKYGKSGVIGTEPAQPGVQFGYALDLSRCIGCRRCVHACVKENNQSRDPEIQWIRVLEFPKEKGIDFAEANPYYCPSGNGPGSAGSPPELSAEQKGILAQPETQYPLYRQKESTPPADCQVPRPENFYTPVQCQQCENPPCVKVCPVQATWKEPDGIVAIDYNWCIGCRYCMAACPYGARHFNWGEPGLPAEDFNPDQHYLGNRPRSRGVVEKCTFCVQRTRKGRYPACVEICPVGARKFGNLLDPESEIRYILEHKRVLVLKNELATKPKFFYFYGL